MPKTAVTVMPMITKTLSSLLLFVCCDWSTEISKTSLVASAMAYLLMRTCWVQEIMESLS